jgi:hypothetical protein
MRSGLFTRSAIPCVVGSLLVALAAFALGGAPLSQTTTQLGLYLSFAWTLLLALGISRYGSAGGWILLGAPLALYGPVMSIVMG